MCTRIARLARSARQAANLAQSCLVGAIPTSTGGPRGDLCDQADHQGFAHVAHEQGAILLQVASQRQHARILAERGLYGTCENCGQPIDPDRLAAFPEATLCITCKRAVEASGKGNRHSAFAA